MKLNNSKHNGSHHVPCLSGISQVPLISENASERLTPIPGYPLTLQSPTIVSHHPPFCTASHIVQSSSASSRLNMPDSGFSPPLPQRSSSTSRTAFDWPTKHQQQIQEETYHLYHEPIDLDDEENDRGSHSIDQLKRKDLSEATILPRRSPTLAEDASKPVSAQPPPLPPPPAPRPPSIVSTINQPSERASPAAQSSPTIDSNNNNSTNSPTTFRAKPGRTFAEQVCIENDLKQNVSADVYFRYVTLKSNERSDHRSRSYHGPKNTNYGNQTRTQFAFNQTTSTIKNLSSTSVAELPLSPALFPSTPTMPILFRDHCVRELIDTESNYVHALEMIINYFAKPLEVLLRKEQNQLIFGHIKYFHHIHSNLHANLVKAAARLSNEELQISTCFLNVREKFLKYGEYCASLSKAQALLDELSKNDTIGAQLNRCQQEANEGRFKLRDLLSLPMQRILKYHLLLAQIIRNTNSGGDDYQGLKRAHDALVDLGQYINEVKRDTEAMQIVNDIEQSITGLHMPPNTKLEDYGRLVMDGSIRYLPKVKLPHDTKRYLFLFDKVILMCKEVGPRRYQYKEALILSEYELELSKHKDKNSFDFNLIRTSDKAVYSFNPKSQESKNKWVNSIQKAMDNIKPNACRSTTHKFLMHTFEKASSCDHCGKLLLGLYYQGYRCQVCFTSVHKKCIPSARSCGPPLPPLRTGDVGRFPANVVKFIAEPFDGSKNDISHLEQMNSYVNFILNERPWFCGRMEREEAQALLESRPHETFLVRESPKHNGSYVISLNFNSQVKHMRIYVSKDNQLYLSHNRYFKSVIELVSWYEKHSLVESFHMLNARLLRPYKTELECL